MCSCLPAVSSSASLLKAGMPCENTSPSVKSLASTLSKSRLASFQFRPTTGCASSVRKSGLKAKPEVGIQFGAGGATSAAELQAEGTRDPSWAVAQARRFLDAGAEIIMVESEGITENVDPWRTDVPARFIDEIGMEK